VSQSKSKPKGTVRQPYIDRKKLAELFLEMGWGEIATIVERLIKVGGISIRLIDSAPRIAIRAVVRGAMRNLRDPTDGSRLIVHSIIMREVQDVKEKEDGTDEVTYKNVHFYKAEKLFDVDDYHQTIAYWRQGTRRNVQMIKYLRASCAYKLGPQSVDLLDGLEDLIEDLADLDFTVRPEYPDPYHEPDEDED
jgi:hypothetical protein